MVRKLLLFSGLFALGSSSLASVGDMRRVGSLTLSSPTYQGLYAAVVDPANGYAYFGTDSVPGRVVKVQLAHGGGGDIPDFDGDGKTDILWRSEATGEVYAWYMDGAAKGGGGSLGSVPDQRWRVAGAADFNGDGKTDILWRNCSTGENYVWFMGGAAQTGGAAVDAVQDLAWKIVGAGDFDGDGMPDVLWRNSSTGDNYVWYMNGVTHAGGAPTEAVSDLNWGIVGAGDFDGDGMPDVLWRNSSTGDNYVWYMNGATHAGGAYLDAVADPAWLVAWVGDYDGDGDADILWRNTSTGENALWTMSGIVREGATYLDAVPEQAWRMWDVAAAVAPVPGVPSDFDGDGKADILWRNSTSGELYVWTMDGVVRKGAGAPIGAVADASWKVVGMADFNSDDMVDLLWRNDNTGDGFVWYMNGLVQNGGAALDAVPDQNWLIVGTGDFNADGKPDILWRNYSTGENFVWYMDGAAHSGGAPFETVADLGWKIAGAADFTGDGKPDILWRNAGTGQAYVWIMDGVTKAGGADLGLVPPEWEIAWTADYSGDGKPDILWRNTATGENYVWYVVSAAQTGGAPIDPVGDLAWEITPQVYPGPGSWALAWGGGSDDAAQNVALDGAGNSYVVGFFLGSADFNPGDGTDVHASNGGRDAFLVKFGKDGNFLWARTWGGSGDDTSNCVAVDSSGNAYVSGRYRNAVDFDPGDGEDIHVSNNPNGANNAYLSKFDADGNFQWARTWGGVGGGGTMGDEAYGATLDQSGNVYVSGDFSSPSVDFDTGAGSDVHANSGFFDAFLVKYDPFGNFQWALTWGGPGYDDATRPMVDRLGNLYVEGIFQNTVDFDPGSGSDLHSTNATAADYGAFVSKLDLDGNFKWARTWGGSGWDIGECVVSDGTNVYVCGYFQGTDDFDPGSGIDMHTSSGGSDAYLVKLDASGSFKWAKTWGGSGDDHASTMALDGVGNVCLTGWFSGKANLDPGGSALFDSSGDTDVYVSKLDNNGIFHWAKTWGGSGSDAGLSLALDGTGNIHVAGWFTGSVDFDPESGPKILTSKGGKDAFLSRLSPSGDW